MMMQRAGAGAMRMASLLSAALVLATASAAPAAPGFVTYESVRGRPYAVGYDARAFTVGGQRTLLLGGSFHPPRVAYGDWARLLRKAKTDGLNHVQIYVFWNYHEKQRGEYNFRNGSRADLAGFFRMAGEAGLFVNVRIG